MFNVDPDELSRPVPERTLRQFAGLCLVVFGSLYALGVAGPFVLVLAAAFGVAGLLEPEVARPVFLLAMALTRPVGHLVSLVLMALIYHGLMTPLGWLLRLSGREKLEPGRLPVDSYWIDRPDPAPRQRYLAAYQCERTLTASRPRRTPS